MSITIACHECGTLTPIDDLDAKPGPGQWTMEQLQHAADTGQQFERLECRTCYGPNWCPLK